MSRIHLPQVLWPRGEQEADTTKVRFVLKEERDMFVHLPWVKQIYVMPSLLETTQACEDDSFSFKGN